MNIFEITKIHNMVMKNRIIRAATGDEYSVNGHYTKKDFDIYEALAKGGVGTITTGFAVVSDYPMNEEGNMLNITDDSYIPEYKMLTDMVHSYNANIVMQLVHCGSYTFVNENAYAPSVIENLETKKMPQELSKADIQRIENDFAQAAYRAKSAGFDGVEIHAGHGFLISEFLTPYYNRRTDEYGGTDEKRALFLYEVVKSVRNAVGEDFPIFIKINCDDGFDGGITYEGFETACVIAEKAGADLILPSGHWYTRKDRKPYYLESTKCVAKKLNIPVCIVGHVREVAEMEQYFENSISYFAMSRPFICEPDFPNKMQTGEIKKVKCVSCNYCVNNPGLICVFNKAR